MPVTLHVLVSAVWAALFSLQLGYGMFGLNGLQSAIMCPAGPSGNPMAPSRGWAGLTSCIPMTPSQFGLVTAGITLGGPVGALSSGPIIRRLGWVGSLRLSALGIAIFAAVGGLTNSSVVLGIMRALTGGVCGLSLVITNLYIADIAPISLRRSMGMLNSMFMVFGTVLSQAVSLSLAKPLIWRWSLGLTSFLAVAQVIASYFVVQISHVEEQEEEERAEEEGLPLVVTSKEETQGVKEVIASPDPKVRFGLVVALVTQVASQASGTSAVLFFSTRILAQVFPNNSRLVALFLAMFKVPCIAIAAAVVERAGTQRLTLFSCAAMAVAAVGLAIGLNRQIPSLTILGIFTFIGSFNIGLGPVLMMIVPEVMPRHSAPAANAIGASVLSISAFVMGTAFLPFQQLLSRGEKSGEGNIFFFFAAICALSFIAVRASYAAYNRVQI